VQEILFVVGAVIFVGLLILLLALDPKYLAIGLRVMVVGAFLLGGLVLVGRGLAILDIPLGAVLVLVMRGWSMRGFAGLRRFKDWAFGWGSGADLSATETAWLKLVRDRATGNLDGCVLAGAFRGAWLHQLTDSQLHALAEECKADPDSTSLIRAYIDRHRRDGGGTGDRAQLSSRDEALAVLGLKEGASRDAVLEAHRRLIQALHPDRGGSNYLASKINAARDLLLRG
jgi:hypothetical protein